MAWMGDEPFPDTVQVESTETLQATHVVSYFVVFHANRTLGVVDAVFLAGFVGEAATSTTGACAGG